MVIALGMSRVTPELSESLNSNHRAKPNCGKSAGFRRKFVARPCPPSHGRVFKIAWRQRTPPESVLGSKSEALAVVSSFEGCLRFQHVALRNKAKYTTRLIGRVRLPHNESNAVMS